MQLTIRNVLAILIGIAVAFGLVFVRIDQIVNVPVPQDATSSLVVKQNLDVILKTKRQTGHESPLDIKSNITKLEFVSMGIPVKAWQLDSQENAIRITYKMTVLEKLRMWLGYDVLKPRPWEVLSTTGSNSG